MNQPLASLVEKLQAIPEYRPLFHKAYPNEPISATTMAKALATFERTVVSDQAPFDRWIEGEGDTISEAAKRDSSSSIHKQAAPSVIAPGALQTIVSMTSAS